MGVARARLILAAFVGFGLSMAIEPSCIEVLSPGCLIRSCTPSTSIRAGDYSRRSVARDVRGYFALNGFVGPIVEELYFRGYLLPRMEWMGRGAPLVNVSFSRCTTFGRRGRCSGRILGFGPTVYAVRWKANVYLGMVVHCTLNVLGVATPALY